MTDVTKIVLNFQDFLIAFLKAFNFAGIERGSDEWDDLTEDIFDILVLQVIKKQYNFSISFLYETWDKDSTKNSLLVKIPSGSRILLAKDNINEPNIHRYQEISSIKNNLEFYFVEFGSPMYDENDLLGLNYVSGITENNDRVCVKKENCQFFINKQN